MSQSHSTPKSFLRWGGRACAVFFCLQGYCRCLAAFCCCGGSDILLRCWFLEVVSGGMRDFGDFAFFPQRESFAFSRICAHSTSLFHFQFSLLCLCHAAILHLPQVLNQKKETLLYTIFPPLQQQNIFALYPPSKYPASQFLADIATSCSQWLLCLLVG